MLFIFILFQAYFFCVSNLKKAQEHAVVNQWTTAFFLEGEHEIIKSALLTTLPNMAKEWGVTFDIKPADFRYSGFASVIHFTIGGSGLGSGAKVGDRIPAIWFHRTRGVLVSTALNGLPAVSKFLNNLPPAGSWTSIEVSQRLVSSKYMFTITVGKKQVFSRENTKPVDLSNVKVYSGSPWYVAQKGSLRNLKIDMNTPIDCVLTGGGNFLARVAPNAGLSTIFA